MQPENGKIELNTRKASYCYGKEKYSGADSPIYSVGWKYPRGIIFVKDLRITSKQKLQIDL